MPPLSPSTALQLVIAPGMNGPRRGLLLLALLAACATPSAPFGPPTPAAPPRPAVGASRAEPLVRLWGAMREVLRDGHTQGRVALDEVLGPDSVAVGAAAGLAAEITVVAGQAHLAEVVDASSDQGLRMRPPAAGEQATLLVLAQVREWSVHALPAVADLAALETLVARVAAESGLDTSQPFPFRVEGQADSLHLHVLDHSCPIANPDGPQPWRFAGQHLDAALIGFHAEDAAGRITHHGQKTHTHALLAQRGISGHLDEVTLAPGARLFLPQR